MSEVIAYIVANYESIVTAVLAVVGAAASIAAITPSPKDDKIIGKIQGVLKSILDVVGMNIGKAKNKE
jgi:phage-related protein